VSTPPGPGTVSRAPRRGPPSADGAGSREPEPALDALGLTATAERVYRALLTRGPATPARLAEYVRTGLADVVAALDDLAELDLVRPGADGVPASGGTVPAAGTQGPWHAESPDIALASLVVRQQEWLLQRQRRLERAQGAVSDLVRLSRVHARRSGGDAVEILDDAAAAARRARHLARTARESVAALDRTPGGLWPAAAFETGAVGTPAADVLDLVRRGVAVQAVYDRAGLCTPGRFDLLRRLAAAGEQARTLPELPMSLVAYDRATAIVHLDERDDAPTTLVVQRSALLTGLLLLFDLLWDRAVPLPPAPDAPSAGREDEFDDVLVALLAAGFKDESIARHLGVSTSTVTRRMARLMEQTGSSTRFQLGMQAVRRHWI
jgi:predicted transcriptional regulator